MNPRAIAASAALLASIALANLVTTEYGQVSAGFGLLVTAGTYFAGLALAFRDVLHEAGGISWVLGTIAAGCALSFALGDGRIALASAVAFLLAELLDLAVYAPLRRKAWRFAVAASNAVGAVVDSFVFLTLAGFGLTWSGVGGQILVKAVWVTAGFLLVAELIRRAAPRAVTA